MKLGLAVKTVVLGAPFLALAGCARPLPPPANPRPDPRDKTGAAYSFTITDTSSGAVLAGRSQIGRGPLKFESHEDGRKALLEIRGFGDAEGNLIVEAHYQEESGRAEPHRTIQWAPAMRIAPHAKGVARVTGRGWSRELSVQLD